MKLSKIFSKFPMLAMLGALGDLPGMNFGRRRWMDEQPAEYRDLALAAAAGKRARRRLRNLRNSEQLIIRVDK